MDCKLLKKRGRGFDNEKEILEKVIDLAGTRIALYVPSQKDIVKKLIEQTFKDVTWKDHPPTTSHDQRESDEQHQAARPGNLPHDGSSDRKKDSPYRPRFAGYEAKHARVRLKKEQAERPSKLEDQKEHYVVEIQVVSVLGHAWAEVEHDIIYKINSSFDTAPQDEMVLLDGLNGMVCCSELLFV